MREVKHKHWSPQQVRGFHKELRSQYGECWHLLVDEVQQAIIHAKVLAIARSQHSGIVTVPQLDELTYALENEFAKEKNP